MPDIIYFRLKDDDPHKSRVTDQQKLNLAWLVEPRLDTEGAACLLQNPIAASIEEFMDKQTREALRGMPLDFMHYWRSVDDGELGLTGGWPADYRGVMEARAKACQRRLTILEETDNVIRVNFRRSA